MDPAGATQTTEFSNPRQVQRLNFETTLGSNLNLVLSQVRTFYGEGQGFTTQNFPNPRAYIHAISLRTHIQIRNPNLLDTFFGAQGQPLAFEPPSNPALPKYDITLRTHLQNTKLNLIGLDTMFAGAGQVLAYDWQLPVLTKFPLNLRSFIQELQQNLLSQDTMIKSRGMSTELVVPNKQNYLYYNTNFVVTDPSFILLPIIIAKKNIVIVVDFGKSFIVRSVELE